MNKYNNITEPEDCGIYAIIAPSGNMYVGSSIHIKHRWQEHKSELLRGIHNNQALQNSWNKYKGNLLFKKLLVCSQQDLLFYEQLCFRIYNPEYNICPVAGNTLGYRATEETKEKISRAGRGRKHSEESKNKIRSAHLGRKKSPEHVKKMADSKRGKKVKPASNERKLKISLANKARWAERKARSLLND